METSQSSPSLAPVVVVSLALHGLLAWSMGGSAHAVAAVRHEPVRVTVREVAKPLPAAPEPALEEVAAPVARSAARHAPRSNKPVAAKKQQQPSAEKAAAVEPALDFTGVTLTSPNGGFAQLAGNGESMTGPLAGAQRGSRQGAARDGKGAAQGADLVALGSLSRAPRAPSLDDALAANYPKNAHDLGLAGEAVVRARILASGQVADTHVLVASAPEFGKACQRTLAGSRWSAPLDATGRPVATELSYKCVFEVTH
ncbi:MAG: energy transducer TonB [Polyangiales bacterium]